MSQVVHALGRAENPDFFNDFGTCPKGPKLSTPNNAPPKKNIFSRRLKNLAARGCISRNWDKLSYYLLLLTLKINILSS